MTVGMRGTSKTLDLALVPFHFRTLDSMALENAENGGGGSAALFRDDLAGMQADPDDNGAECRLATSETSCFEGAVLDRARLEDLINDRIGDRVVPEFAGEHLVPERVCRLVRNFEEPFPSGGRREWSRLGTGAVLEKRHVVVVLAETDIIIVRLKLGDEFVADESRRIV